MATCRAALRRAAIDPISPAGRAVLSNGHVPMAPGFFLFEGPPNWLWWNNYLITFAKTNCKGNPVNTFYRGASFGCGVPRAPMPAGYTATNLQRSWDRQADRCLDPAPHSQFKTGGNGEMKCRNSRDFRAMCHLWLYSCILSHLKPVCVTLL